MILRARDLVHSHLFLYNTIEIHSILFIHEFLDIQTFSLTSLNYRQWFNDHSVYKYLCTHIGVSLCIDLEVEALDYKLHPFSHTLIYSTNIEDILHTGYCFKC